MGLQGVRGANTGLYGVLRRYSGLKEVKKG